MSKEKHILDDVLRNAASQVDIPDMSSSWDGIASGLDALGRRRRRRIIVLVSILLLAGLSVVLSTVDLNPKTERIVEDETTPAVVQDKLIEQDQADVPVATETDIIEHAISDENVIDESESGYSNEIETRTQEDIHHNGIADASKNSGDIPSDIEEDGIPETYISEDIGDVTEDATEEITEDNSKDIAQEDAKRNETPDEFEKEDIVEPTNEDESVKDVAQADQPEPKDTKGGESTSSNSTTQNSGWELNISASPGLAAKMIAKSADFGWLVHRDYGDARGSEYSSFSYQVDVGINRKFNDRFYMGLGVRYVERGENVQYDHTIDELVTVRQAEQELIYTELAPILWQQVKYDGFNRYQFIDIPVKFGILTPLTEHLSWRNEVSVNYSRLLSVSGKKVDGTYMNLIDANSIKMNKNNLGFTGKSGFMWSTTSRVDWSLDVLYNMNWSSWRAKENGLLERPLNYGVTLGWNYKLQLK